MTSAIARARHDGPECRPGAVAESIRAKFDPQGIYDYADWHRIAKSAVAQVNVARAMMLLDPVGGEG